MPARPFPILAAAALLSATPATAQTPAPLTLAEARLSMAGAWRG